MCILCYLIHHKSHSNKTRTLSFGAFIRTNDIDLSHVGPMLLVTNPLQGIDEPYLLHFFSWVVGLSSQEFKWQVVKC